MIDRLSFGFHNPNHAAALVCALLPLCWGWRRCLWLGRLLSLALFLALLMTQSRTGLVVALSEAAAWWRLQKGRFRVSHLRSHKLVAAGIAAFAVAALWWMWPRMALDGSMLNRPRIWLAGLRLFAANPDGVGTGHNVVGTGPGGVSTNIHELTRIQIRFVRFVLIRRGGEWRFNDSALHLHLKPAPILESEVGGRGGEWRLTIPRSTSTSSLHLSLSWRWEVEVEHGG